MEVKDFLLNEIKSGEYRLNTDRSLAGFDAQLKCIYHLQTSFRGKLDWRHLKMRIYLRKIKTHEKATKKVQEKLSARVKKENAADADVRRA